MSNEGEEPDIKDVIRRLDDLTRILRIILDDLMEISRILKERMISKIEGATPSLRVSVGQTQRLRTIDDVQKAFPHDLLGLLFFEVTEEYIIIKPRQYLGSENFSRIASIVRDQLRGEYVSQGKESHFRVPRKI